MFTLDIDHQFLLLCFPSLSPHFGAYWSCFSNVSAYLLYLRHRRHVWGHCGILRSEQDISGCCCGIKRNSTSRRQNIEHFSPSCCVAALLSGRAPWSSKPSRVQPHRSWGTEYNKEYNPFANSFNPFFFFVSCLWTLSNVTSNYNYFLRILIPFLYYAVIFNSTVLSLKLTCDRCLVFFFFFQ